MTIPVTSFRVAPEVFQLVPGACFGVVVAYGIDNSSHLEPGKQALVQSLLTEAITATRSRFADTPVKSHPAIVPYRQAMQAMGINPNKFPSAIEALSSRIAKGNNLPSINPVVDLVNAVSLTYSVPMGAHDLGPLVGGIYVRPAGSGAIFQPMGQDAREEVPPDEIVYADDIDVRTRRWIWRQSERGKVTGDSRNIFFPIDGFKDHNLTDVLAARDHLARLLQEIFSARVITGFVDRENPVFVWQLPG